MVTGKVKRVLTKKKNHSRGHKVMLEDGTVGRMIKIIDTKPKTGKSKINTVRPNTGKSLVDR